MKVVGVIPARYGSTRFPGKPLALIAGRPLLSWVIKGASQCRSFSRLIVATDDERIAKLARDEGAEVAMTATDLPTGTDRIWQAVKNEEVDLVVNVQGDEPLIEGWVLEKVIEPFHEDVTLPMATLASTLDYESLMSPNTAKIVVNTRHEALYFSRFPIPYSRVDAKHEAQVGAALKHIGIYAYRKTFLEQFCAQTQTDLERAESLEQLRALHLGARIKVAQVNHESWGVDTPQDVEKIEQIMKSRSVKG